MTIPRQSDELIRATCGFRPNARADRRIIARGREFASIRVVASVSRGINATRSNRILVVDVAVFP